METRTGERRMTVSATLPKGSGESSSRPWLPIGVTYGRFGTITTVGRNEDVVEHWQ